MSIAVNQGVFHHSQERAPGLLHNVAVATTENVQLSSFVEFSYSRPLQVQHYVFVHESVMWNNLQLYYTRVLCIYMYMYIVYVGYIYIYLSRCNNLSAISGLYTHRPRLCLCSMYCVIVCSSVQFYVIFRNCPNTTWWQFHLWCHGGWSHVPSPCGSMWPSTRSRPTSIF